jgi:hypothetical protein
VAAVCLILSSFLHLVQRILVVGAVVAGEAGEGAGRTRVPGLLVLGDDGEGDLEVVEVRRAAGREDGVAGVAVAADALGPEGLGERPAGER